MLTLIAHHLNGDGNTDVEATELPKDDVFHLLQNSRRRAIIQTLHENEPVSKRELTELVTEIEYDVPREQVSSSERKCVQVSLHQNHLAKLEDHSVIKTKDELVMLGPTAEQLIEFMDLSSGFF